MSEKNISILITKRCQSCDGLFQDDDCDQCEEGKRASFFREVMLNLGIVEISNAFPTRKDWENDNRAPASG